MWMVSRPCHSFIDQSLVNVSWPFWPQACRGELNSVSSLSCQVASLDVIVQLLR